MAGVCLFVYFPEKKKKRLIWLLSICLYGGKKDRDTHTWFGIEILWLCVCVHVLACANEREDPDE